MVLTHQTKIKAGRCEGGTQQIALYDLYVRRIIAVRCGRVRLRKVNTHHPSGRFDRLRSHGSVSPVPQPASSTRIPPAQVPNPE